MIATVEEASLLPILPGWRDVLRSPWNVEIRVQAEGSVAILWGTKTTGERQIAMFGFGYTRQEAVQDLAAFARGCWTPAGMAAGADRPRPALTPLERAGGAESAIFTAERLVGL